MFRKLIVLTLLLIGVIAPTTAQADDWQVLFYDGTAIQVLTPYGLAGPIDLPEGAQNIEPYHGLGYMSLSPDASTMVFSRSSGGSEGNIPLSTLEIADLANNTCCIVVANPLQNDPDTIVVGPFSPDGTQVVAVFADVYSGALQSVVAVVDVASGSIIHQADTMATFGDVGVIFGTWDAEGIKGAATCLACGGHLDGMMSNWNPETGVVTPDVEYFNIWGDKLQTTGEYVIPERNDNLTVSSEDGMMPPSNTVIYRLEGNPDTTALIYYDPNHLLIGNVNWVMGGNAYLITEWDGMATVVQRNGTVFSADVGEAQGFLSSTPDGWLMQDYTTQALTYFQVQDGQITATSFDQFLTRVVMLTADVGMQESLPLPLPVVK